MFEVMPLETQFIIGLQLILAALLSGIIGSDRERHNGDAGLRTHILVGVGSCLFTALSINGFVGGEGTDPSRVASQIIPGIGFLGAGAILKDGVSIRGLTTAASIWATAAVGMAIGVGAWLLAVIATLVVWFVLAIMRRVEKSVFGPTANRRNKAARADNNDVNEPL